MPEIIENGHVYIAQPPLYKAKKGKAERYVKDDSDLENYMMELALDGATVTIAGQPPVTSEALAKHADDYLARDAIRSRLTTRIFPDVVDEIGRMPELDPDASDAAETAKNWMRELESRLNGGDEAFGDYESPSRQMQTTSL